MTLPLLIAGLILLLAGSGWFAGAATVGLILTIVGGVGLAIQLVLFLIVAGSAAKSARRDFSRF